MNSSSRNDGFTLLEVLIVIAILAFMSLGIYQLMTETFRLRESLANEGDFYNSIRLSMAVMNRDISLLYSPAILLPNQGNPTPIQSPVPGQPPSPPNPASQNPPPDFSGLPANIAGDFQQTSDYWGPAFDKTGIRPSRFQGNETKMSFVSASHVRLYKDSPESEFAKISYEIKKDEDPSTNFSIPDSNALVRSENVDVFDTDDTRDKDFAHRYKILYGITKASFAYCFYDPTAQTRTKTCNKSWDSEKTTPPHQFPDIIQITLQVKGPTDLSFDGTYEFRPEVPLHGIVPSS